ncbi:hypothetical protein GB931_10795 [Modestobacter sp. I12A-02628]|uniref:Uncharacterized protein n=1 Tax=Goekera deserti TaxID=2497753 RepID=A0A7K3WDG8_9ACTN|nr:hypothetical protein [Goekera deserti]MPQ98394.1 hypothetical protein [Goekera deserti]NDI48220.1 hypothetical protein [Goekera deserti]NEL53969.1 hypothetical protein [Goekera deserti]
MQISSGHHAARPRHTPAAVRRRGVTALDPDQRGPIAAVGGLAVASGGASRDPGPDPDPDPDHDPDPLVAALVQERSYGRLLGQVTPSYLRSVARRYTEHPGPSSSFSVAA